MSNEKALSDLALAAFLSSKGYEILSIRGNGSKSFFVFEDSPELEQDMLRYFNRQGMVDALTYGEVLRNLKALILNRS